VYSFRNAILSDVDSIAYVHVTSWQETYTGLLDDSVIGNFDIENRKKMWSSFLQKEMSSQRVYVAVHSDKIVGIASWSVTSDHVELVTLYVLSEFQHQGIGTGLFRQVENNATEREKPLIVWVLEGNNSVVFYEKMGLQLKQRELKKIG